MKQLTSVRVEALRRRLDRIARKDEKVAEATLLAATFGDEEEPPEEIKLASGMWRRLTKAERQIAKDARKPKRYAPVYLEMSHRRFAAQRAAEAERPASITLNAQAIQFVLANPDATARYPVIEVTPESATGERDNGGK